MARAGGRARQQRALDQALGVDDTVVTHPRQRMAELAELAPVRKFEHILAPAPQRHRNRPVHARVHADDVAIGLFHHPVDARARKARADVAHHRQIVHDVAEQRKF